MVGIVVVSHSILLAQGVVELATQMTQGKANIAIAAGVDDPENPIGTDAIAVMAAIEQVCDDDGVVVLMDLGSALLSTEMALELLDPELADKVSLISAPIVEGTMAASVAAAAGLPREAVIAEASSALDVKKAHLGEATSVQQNVQQEDQQNGQQDGQNGNGNSPSIASQMPDSLTLSFEWQVQNPHGLHARPAAAIVGALASFDADLVLFKGDQQANTKSLNSIAKLGVRCGEVIRLQANGAMAQQAIDAFTLLANDHFGEAAQVSKMLAGEGCFGEQGEQDGDNPEEPLVQSPENAAPEGALAGIRVSDGVAIAPAAIFSAAMPAVPKREFAGASAEMTALNNAIAQVQQDLTTEAAGPHGAIFEAHRLMLADPEITRALALMIAESVISEQAWLAVMEGLAAQYAAAESQYMREREADIWDITRRVMVALTGDKGSALTLTEPVVLFARDLMPSDVASLDKSKVLAICLSEGGKTSHSAILARAMGIPALVKTKGCLEQVHAGDPVILDGFAGHLWFAPTANIAQTLELKRQQWRDDIENSAANAQAPAITKAGRVISVLANIGGPDDVAQALACGAEGVGLFRTEFLFQQSDALPSEEEQYQVYRDIAAAFGDKPVTIRSLDVGGDKPLVAYPMPAEDNPFLGQRGVRLCLAHPELFATQLRAILRAHAEQPNIQLMIPMIATVAEVQQVKALLVQQCAQLGLSDTGLAVGIMIEVPAAVFNAESLAKEVDFFSIGTNDLTQYVMAADRGNSAIAELVDYFQPAVISAIAHTCEIANKAGISVSMCGEMAGDTKATETLLSLGLSKFSASAALLPALKETIRHS
ncbi:phosphoenolpyruvate--protein phosphotransferase [Photobacterium sanguinicancri]|uniref:phosphoenolpyruvate--protein phosphotransferase n=1 Tax=Photobacterium sanguinicancri TaxID=875932 RepID=UPI0026E34B93|nr:phosphoenolpyruvate--protein phosphotransferase [Photobacterium sanguinicancri]MDO6496950.1 phosphoenolpyruvate--protein phosphotransferase [Photobacterium sanguinicancri]